VFRHPVFRHPVFRHNVAQGSFPRWLTFFFAFGGGCGQSLASQAVAGKINPVSVVNDAIEDGVGVGGVADQLVPFVDRAPGATRRTN
jgi:hypothetical protein